jgi:hypothetical protein
LQNLQTKNANLGKFCRVFQWKMLVYVITIWSISWPFGIFVAILEFLWPFGIFFPYWDVVPRKIWQTMCQTSFWSNLSCKKVLERERRCCSTYVGTKSGDVAHFLWTVWTVKKTPKYVEKSPKWSLTKWGFITHRNCWSKFEE